MLRDLDSHLLRAFVTVIETGSVSAAAHKLSRTQAAVSMQLRRLEELLGQRLLERSPRGATLTGAGQMLMPYAQRILEAGADAQRLLSDGHVSGTVRLGLLEDVAVGRLPAVLQRFCASYEDVVLEMIVDSSKALSRMLTQGELDIVIGDPGVIDASAVKTWTQPLRWVGSRNLKIDWRKTPLPVIAFVGTCAWQDKAFAALNRARIPWRIACKSTSLLAIQAAVEGGLGVAVMLTGHVRHDSMRILSAREGLPPAPYADFGLFTSNLEEGENSAQRVLLDFLSEDIENFLTREANQT
ncbi:LysR substrate-binding domain-containing protein [Pseudomonas sp. RGM2987]|uniref:LysR substrate-binding domain-containing protein n=1 Tax=Pseudomonas sp. RGM2987 TaxID=2930090 RepID=UPI001FD6593C|nr:LysR substrate-binding domain-containing protein [Pseudomonas sp. RGM2987]MCJ8206799.1 LysR substrate-binding domain-containing protein [Pseudomonas sp. RGM2987]